MALAVLTFLPSGIDARSTSTLAMAKTSADADMFFRNSARRVRQPQNKDRIKDATQCIFIVPRWTVLSQLTLLPPPSIALCSRELLVSAHLGS